MNIKELAAKRSAERAGKREAVPMPEWGEGAVVYVGEMSAKERDLYEGGIVDAKGKGTLYDNFRARLVALVVVNEDGTRVWGDGEVEAVGQLPARDIRKLFEVASKLNALTPDDEKELEKN